ncbi:hypothetical protein ACLOJK_039841 [Asimina triloba]
MGVIHGTPLPSDFSTAMGSLSVAKGGLAGDEEDELPLTSGFDRSLNSHRRRCMDAITALVDPWSRWDNEMQARHRNVEEQSKLGGEGATMSSASKRWWRVEGSIGVIVGKKEGECGKQEGLLATLTCTTPI